jgi:hypothetical protein
MYWMYQSLNTAESMGLKLSGIKPSGICLNLRGIPRENFGLLLKEREWRFNTPTAKAQLNQWLKGFL